MNKQDRRCETCWHSKPDESQNPCYSCGTYLKNWTRTAEDQISQRHQKHMARLDACTKSAEAGIKRNLEQRRNELMAKLCKWIVLHPPQYGGDHACAECYPEEELIVPGFVCAYHEALRMQKQIDTEQRRQIPVEDRAGNDLGTAPVCHCGSMIADHTQFSDHSPIEMEQDDIAENGPKGREFGIMHKKASTIDKQAGWCAAVCIKRYREWETELNGPDFLEYLAKKYAPENVANDPHGLNSNWLRNVRRFMKEQK